MPGELFPKLKQFKAAEILILTKSSISYFRICTLIQLDLLKFADTIHYGDTFFERDMVRPA